MSEITTAPTLNGEKLIGLAELAKSLPAYRGNGSMVPSTILRWILYGCRRRGSGARLRLEARKLGARWMTSKEAVQRFIEELSRDELPSSANPSPRTPAQSERASRKAAERLEAMGA